MQRQRRWRRPPQLSPAPDNTVHNWFIRLRPRVTEVYCTLDGDSSDFIVRPRCDVICPGHCPLPPPPPAINTLPALRSVMAHIMWVIIAGRNFRCGVLLWRRVRNLLGCTWNCLRFYHFVRLNSLYIHYITAWQNWKKLIWNIRWTIYFLVSTWDGVVKYISCL